MTRILIVAEHDGHTLNLSTAKCVSCAKAIGGDIDIALLGQGHAAVGGQAAALAGVARVLVISAEHLAHPLAANWAPEIFKLAADYTHVLGPSTTMGKDLMPRVAALAGVNQFSDVMEVVSPRSFRRPIYAGNAIIDVQAPEGQRIVMTVRTASWPATGAGGNAAVEQRTPAGTATGHSRYVALNSAGGQRPDLQSATKVVSGGRALGSAEPSSILQRAVARFSDCRHRNRKRRKITSHLKLARG